MSIDIVTTRWLFLITIFLVLVSIEIGHRLGYFAHQRSKQEKESPVSAMTASVLGLTAFMLAFTFGIVSDRYYHKKELVREDANAIKIAFLRADFLPLEKDRIETKSLIHKYLSLRLDLAQSQKFEENKLSKGLSETETIQNRLWDMAVINARKDMNSDVSALYIESLNEMNKIHMLRVAVGIQERIPNEIWLVLYAITMLGMIGVGYQTAIAGSRRSLAGPILAISFAMVFALISTLDRPAGIIKVSQQPLIDLKNSMRLI